MPTYLYKCQDCGHRFEHFQGFHDDPLEVCPDCQGTVRRVIGNVGVTFKGSGFYRTDSREAGKKKSSSSSSGSTSSSSKSSDSAGSSTSPKSTSSDSSKGSGSSTSS
ncbi:MAG: zinc ribbon domain-containing protein [Candidatus Nanopelagicales bacterium]|nr:zinc ribbon domain-containing protein [Candidatus Nanopelagicales bacterium]